MALIVRAELTKGFLMAQRTGNYLVSTCAALLGPHAPRFNERVAPMGEREAQWLRIKAARADGSSCRVRMAEELTSKEIAIAKLTKRFLMAQPEGVFVASGQWVPVTPGTPEPIFAEIVAQLDGRETQWERIKAAGADGRHCNVYNGPEDHAKWIAAIHDSESDITR